LGLIGNLIEDIDRFQRRDVSFERKTPLVRR
jgi:hypothetical protein